MLEIDQLSVRYGPVAAVRGISLHCAGGEIVTIVGANGAGKSSTLMAIAGGIRGNVRGSITLDGNSLTSMAAERRVAAGVSLVPERRRILASLTVRENLQVATASRRDKADARREVDTIMGRFPILGSRASKPAGLLSGGEQQQLAIGRALLARPRFLLLDEPSLGLAPKVVDEIFALVVDLRADGIGVLLVEQNAKRASAIADRTLLLRQGAIQADVADHDAAASLDHYFGLNAPAAEN